MCSFISVLANFLLRLGTAAHMASADSVGIDHGEEDVMEDASEVEGNSFTESVEERFQSRSENVDTEVSR